MEQNAFITSSSRRFRFKRIIILIFISLFINSCLSGTHIEKEVFYIPDEMEGKIFVLFDCEDGKPKKWKNGKRLYEIPPSGVLKTKFKENTGYISFKEEGIAYEVDKYKEWVEFYYADNEYRPIKKINYVPYYAPDYRSYLEKNGINATGTNAVSISSNGKDEYTNTHYYIFSGDSLTYNTKFFPKKRKEEWSRIKNWDTYDYRDR